MKTGFYPMKVKLKLFFKWGIQFEEKKEMLQDYMSVRHYEAVYENAGFSVYEPME